jgi:hypothetical protein
MRVIVRMLHDDVGTVRELDPDVRDRLPSGPIENGTT